MTTSDSEVKLDPQDEQEKRRAQRLEAIGTLAGGIAHDFNNLIFSIKLIATELAATESDPKRRASLEAIDELTERSGALTRSLLGFARRTSLRAVPIGVNDAVSGIAELLTRTLAGLELSFELAASDRGMVIGEHAELEQLVMILVLNARDRVAGSGRVVVRTSDLGPRGAPQFVVLEVTDDGPAVPDELRAQLLEPAGEPGVAEPPARDDRVRGLGLVAARAIAERHRGTIEIDAGPGGSGATLRVALPVVAKPPETRHRYAAGNLPRGSGLVLVIDDDPMVRRVVSGSLGVLGYQTIEAGSGKDAVELYRARHAEIRAVVLDMIMPGMTGRAVYLGLRAIREDVIVLLMSGHTLNEHVQELLDLGVRAFVSKPYSIGALANAMSELLK